MAVVVPSVAASPDRRTAAALAVGAVAGCALLAVVDPNEPGRYPSCPTRALLGIDCPACGTLRGVHALLHGDVGAALGHNLLLLLAVPVGLAAWWGWVRTALGQPPRHPSGWPAWAVGAAVVMAVAFTVVRNTGLAGLGWLDSA